MSASEFIFIYDIPNHYSPLTLMLDISNTFAKMTYFDSPDFKGNRQAFVFYPEVQPGQWGKVMEKLRSKDPVQASYVWFPEGDAEYIEHIPDGVDVLPYIYVENLPKDVDFHQVVFGLPHIVNLRFMDVTYKDDKWALIYLGPKVDRQLRRHVVMGLRSKSFNGYQVYASELMVTQSAEFPKPVQESNLAPKPSVPVSPVGSAFRSEFLFLYNVPQPLGHGKILHFIKSMGVKLARVFFIETVDHLKRGFLHLPTLSQEEWDHTVECLRSHFFHVAGLPEGCGERIDVDEVWFQPHGAAAPEETKGDLLLTDYYFVYNIPRGVSEQLLVHGCGFNRVRIQLFDPTTPDSKPTKIGFAVRLSTAPDRKAVEEALDSIRSKRFGDSAVFVDRIWRNHVQDPERARRLRLALPSVSMATVERTEETAMEEESSLEICCTLRAPVPFLSKVPLLFIHGIPCSYEDSALLADVTVARSAGLARPQGDMRCCFIQPTYLDRHSWSCALSTLYLRILQSNLGAEVNEVFRENSTFTGDIPEGMVRSCFLFISNLPLDAKEAAIMDGVPHVEQARFLLPTPSTEQHLVLLLSSNVDSEVSHVITALREKQFGGRRPAVHRLWLSTVEAQGMWPSYRAPCQADEEEEAVGGLTQEVEEMEGEELAIDRYDAEAGSNGPAENMDVGIGTARVTCDGDGVKETNGQSLGLITAAPACVVVDGLPLLTTDKSVCDILGNRLDDKRHAFCVVTSPSAQSNRLIVFAASPAEAQSLLRELAPPLKKHFRHRALLTRTNSTDSPEELIPVSADMAFQFGATSLLVYGLPRLAASNVRSLLREVVDPASCSLDLKWSGKRFLGHAVLTFQEWQTCNSAFKGLQNKKFGNTDVKVKFLTK